MVLQCGLHEMSIAAGVFDALRVECLQHPSARLTRAGLRIGELSGVEIESLRFYLEVLAPDAGFPSLAFEFEVVPWSRRCRQCGATFRVVDAHPACAICGSEATEAAGGDQLELSFLELEEN